MHMMCRCGDGKSSAARLLLAGAVFAGVFAVHAAAQDPNQPPFPCFRVTYAAGPTTLIYDTPDETNDNVRTWDGPELDAELTYLGDNYWELEIEPHANVLRVDFPYMGQGWQLPGGNLNDDVFYLPWYAGRAILCTALDQYAWSTADGDCAPGINDSYLRKFFSPFIIYADGSHSNIIFAANDEPRWCIPRFRFRQAIITYPYTSAEPLAAESTDSYKAYVEYYIDGDASTGYHPWRAAARKYKSFLKDLVLEIGDPSSPGVYPRYPQWMKEINGFLGVLLTSIPGDAEDVEDALDQIWEDGGDLFPWIQFWGQMSGYDGECCSLTPVTPIPSPDPNNNWDGALHDRYESWLPGWANAIASGGDHVGYYTRPRDTGDDPNITSMALDDTVQYDGYTNIEWFDAFNDWTETEWNANAHYYDVLGANGNYGDGDGSHIADLLYNVFSNDTMVEFCQDVYPSAIMMSGLARGYDYDPHYPDDVQPYRPYEDIRGREMRPADFGNDRSFKFVKVEFWQSGSALTDLPAFGTLGEPDYAVYDGQGYPLTYWPGTAHIDPNDGSFIDGWGNDTNMINNFAMRASGYLSIDEPGQFTFTLESTNRSQLWLDTGSGLTKILDTSEDLMIDPVHGRDDTSNTITFPQSDQYPKIIEIVVYYFNDASGLGEVRLHWQTPTWSKRSIGSSSYYHDETLERCSFPAIQRFVMDEHIAFIGQCNYGYYLTNYKNHYRQERSAFLLGMKHDTICDYYDVTMRDWLPKSQFGVYDCGDPNFALNDPCNMLNPYLVESTADRLTANWSDYKLCFRDTEGITNIGSGMRVTRFVDPHCNNWFCCDNPTDSTLSFTFDGTSYAVDPNDPLQIITVAADPNCPCTDDPCGVLGDMNYNGKLDIGDIDAMDKYLDDGLKPYEAAYPGGYWRLGDMDDDGDVDKDDRSDLLIELS